MNHSDLTNILEDCIQKLAAGVPLEVVLAQYPDQQEELRELLIAAMAVQKTNERVRIPASAQVDSRRRFLTRADDLVEQSSQRPGIFQTLRGFVRDHFQSAVIVLASLLLLFIALRSAGTFPIPVSTPDTGSQHLEPLLTGSAFERMTQALAQDQQRAAGVEQMIAANQGGEVHFAGFLKQQGTGGWEAAGIDVQVPTALENQAQALAGVYVQVDGTLEGSSVQVTALQPWRMDLEGTLQSRTDAIWQVDSLALRVTENTAISGSPQIGDLVQVQVGRMDGVQEAIAASIRSDGPLPSARFTPTETPEEATATLQPGPSTTGQKTPFPTRTPRTLQQTDPGSTVTPEVHGEKTQQRTEEDHEEEDNDDHKDKEED